MERIKTVVGIISIPPVSSEKDLTQHSSSILNFQQFFIKYFSKKQIKQLNSLTNKCQSVNELFNKEKLAMQFDPNKLKRAIDLIKLKIDDKIIVNHLALFTLYQYIAFIIIYEQNSCIESITILFNSLALFSKNDFQNHICSALTDIISIIMDNYKQDLFKDIFDSFSNFLLSRSDINGSIYFFLPSFLERLIQDNGLSSTSLSSKLASLISLLLSKNPKSFSPNTINYLFKVIHPFLQTVNEFALVIMQYLAPLLDVDQINTFFLDLPSIIPQVIEASGNPFITPPPEIEYESFNPPPSPQCHFGFPEIETFVTGFDASSTPYLPTPSLSGLVNSQFFYLIDLVVKVIGNGSDEAVLFLDSFSTLVDAKASSKFKYDYLGLMVFIWVKITDKLPIVQIKIPKSLFQPTLSVFDENLQNSQFFFSIRFYGLNSILKVAEPHLDELLLENVKYPLLLTELVEICNLNLDKVSNLIMNQQTMIRTIRLIGLQLQSAEFTKEISVKCIESARLSVFRLIFRIFISTSFVYSFLNDILFMSFFFSLLFEENIRPFVLSQLKVYITCDLDAGQYEIFMSQLCQVIDQVCRVLPQKSAFYLISDTLSTLIASKMKPELMIDLCYVLQRSLQFFDDSDMSRFLLLQIISFFTMISRTTSKLPISCISSLEIPLKNFKDLGENDFNALLCLSAADKLTSYKPNFIIKNGEMINTMFHVFYSKPEINIVDFINKLSHYNIKNCVILHQSHFDLNLLDFLIENRESDDPNIPRILDVVSTIASCISSPAVVQRYIALFIPAENRYLTKTHQYLLKPLLTAFQRAQMSPSLVLPLNKRYIIPTTVSKTQFEKEGFTFAFWLYYTTSDETTIFCLLNGDEKPYFTLGMKDNAITINGKQKPLTIPAKTWTFITFLYQSGTAIIYLDLEETWKSTNTHIKFAIGVPSVKIGEQSDTQVRLGNFGLFDSFDPNIIPEIYNLGPRTIQVKRKPIFYFTQENMRALTGYSNGTENRTFTDILIRFFKVEIFLPLFAQLDLKTKSGELLNFNVHDVVSILKAALVVGEMEQHDFLQANGFSIISHLLCSSSAKHVSFKLYNEFFDIYDILVLEELRKQLFSQIIMNFDLWIVATPEEHIQILLHWGKAVFKKCKTMFVELFPFSYLLDILRIYYWYDPIEKSKIRCDPTSRRPRNPDLNITNCRSKLYNIMYDLSFIQFRNEDLSALMEHVITLADSQQQLDLLLFMNSLALAPHHPLSRITIPIPILTRLSYLLQSGNDQIVTAIFNVIHNVYSTIPPGELTLVQHFDGLTKDIEVREMSIGLLEDLKTIMLYTTSLLFPICSYIGYRLNSLELFQQTQPSERYVVSPNWALWPVAEAMKINDNAKRRFIFSFLARCSVKQWQAISDMIEIVAQANGGDIDVDEYRAHLLKIFLNITIKIDSQAFGHDILATLFQMIKQHIFFRKRKEEKDNNYSSCSSALFKLFEDSPFSGDENSDIKQENNQKKTELRHLYHFDILNLTFDQINYTFGLRLDSEGKWLDEELARLTLHAIAKYRKVIDELDFGFVLAGFLLNTKSSEKAGPTRRRACRSNSTSKLDKLYNLSNSELNSDNSSNHSLLSEDPNASIDLTPRSDSSLIFNSQVSNNDQIAIENNKSSSNSQIDEEYHSINSNQPINTDQISENPTSSNDQIAGNATSKIDNSSSEVPPSVNSESAINEDLTDLGVQSRLHLRASLSILSDDSFPSSNSSSNTKYSIHNNTDFVNHWLGEMQLVKETCESHKTCSQFLVARANMEQKSIIIKTQLAEAYSGMQQVLETLPTRFFDNNIANSSLITHRTMKNFSQQAANNLFLAQQQEIRNAEFENDINLATEFIQFNDENNSKLWQRLWSNAVSDGSPWDISKITGKRDKPRWRRDICYCKFFCPFKLKPNRKYTNHYESSIARDAGNKQNYSRIIEEYKQHLIDEYKKNAPAELLEIPPSNLSDANSNTGTTTTASATTVTAASGAQIATSSSNINSSSSTSNASTLNVTKKKKKKIEYKCELVKMMGVSEGTFSVFDKAIHIDIESTKKTYILPTILIKRILLRRRFHHKTAIEIFMDSGESYFVNFPQYRSVEILNRMVLPERVFVQKDEPAIFFAQTGLTEKWRRCEISNFEYLMMLNIISGRSFNDSSQYPFLPWVLSDYTSEVLNLEDPKSFRDLSKPIGAIGEARFQQIQKRMKDMQHFGAAAYLYSSFAVCPLSLYLWLFRMEPFTTLHIDMQSGKFDHPSRLFSSIPDTYNIVTSNMNDYRELVPEFYFLPDFLRNDNELDLGKAKGVPIGDVVLPKWAKTCEECVYLFRKALESDIASSMIHKWIDLIWGYKQRGEKAVESDNLYSSEMYETAWTPQVLKDPRRRAEIEASMCHVGQFPPQLFTSPHPEKLLRMQRYSTQVTIVKLPYQNIQTACLSYKNHLNLALSTNTNEIACLTFASHSQQPQIQQQQQQQQQGQNEFQFQQLSLQSTNSDLFLDPNDTLNSTPENANESENGNVRIANDVKFKTMSKVLSIQAANCSNEFVCLLSNGRIIRIIDYEASIFHRELTRVSSISCSENFIGVVSDDTTLNLFGKNLPSYSIPFYGNSVLCCAISTTFKIAVCGTISGDIVVSSLYEGRKINVIKLGKEYRPTKLLITNSWGFIVTYATTEIGPGGEKSKQFIFVHNINGTFIRSVQLTGPITAWCAFSSNSDFDYLAISFDQGKLHLFEAFYLDIGDPFYRCYNPVVNLFYLKDSRMIVAVKDDGNVVFHPISLD
ncbi:hypothetical protein M9Y10_009917 [Tritrichomonas musculus]|uniref:BEACH domain-containing protein n=1 Tax=Tritrichomonas musculus TaxID=1915356 RepID=A0ABR2IRA3_9EUKA